MCWARIGSTLSRCWRAQARRPAFAIRTSCSAEGRCPPADIGGPIGYETYLRSIADPSSVNHDDMLDFDAPDFDPNVVDEAALRGNLASLTKYIGRKIVSRHPEVRAERASKDAAEALGPSPFEGRSAATSG